MAGGSPSRDKACQGGRLAANLPWWMGKKPRRDVPYEFQTIARALGWLMLDKIIWVKGDENNIHTSGGWGGGGCGWGTYLSPSGPSIRCASEPILILAKGAAVAVASSPAKGGPVRAGDMTKEEWMEWTMDVWFVRGASDRQHPAVSAGNPEAAHQTLHLPGDVVLDPHNGSGTTTTTAQLLGRQFVGIDANPEYCRTAEARVMRPNDEVSDGGPLTHESPRSAIPPFAALTGWPL